MGDADDLAEKLLRMIAMTSEDRELMGQAGRRKMELEFDEQIVIHRYLEVIRELQ